MRATFLLLGFALMLSFPIGNITLFPLGGFLLIFFAVLRLEQIEPTFKKVRYPLYPAIGISLAVFGLEIYATAVGNGTFYGYTALYSVIRILCELSEGVTMGFIYVGLKVIGSNADVPALEKQSSRNMTVMVVYLISQLSISLIRMFAPQLFKGFEIIVMYPLAFGVIWRVLNIWSAYTLMNKISVSKN